MARNTTFESLPSEILIEVLSRLPDLESLYCMIRASPDIWRLFDKFGLGIAEAVLNSGYTHKHTQTIIRTVAHVRANCFPINDISELQRRVTREAIRHVPRLGFGKNGEPCKDAFSPNRFPEFLTISSLRGILATTRQARSLTTQCLDYYLTRFRSLTPLVPVDSRYPPDIQRSSRAMRIRAENTPKRRFAHRDLGPPSWVEEQLVYRAIWRIQLVKDLIRALKDNVLPGWKAEEYERLSKMDIVDIYDFEQAHADVLEFHGLFDSSYLECEMAEESLVLMVLQFLSTIEPTTQQCGGLGRTRAIADPQPGDHAMLEQDWSPAGELYSERIYLAWHPFDDEDEHTFKMFRNLGFAIWTIERLSNFGLAVGDNPNDFGVLIAWLSVLQPEEYEYLERLERQMMEYVDREELQEIEDLLRQRVVVSNENPEEQ